MTDNTANSPIELWIPAEVWGLIASLLDSNELARFRQVCKLFKGAGSHTMVLQPLYNRLFAIDKTLPADLQTAAVQAGKPPLVFFKEAFEKIQTRQQLEIAYLIQHHPAIMAIPAYVVVLQQNTSVTLKSLEAKHAILDAVNSEIVTTLIDINSNLLDLDSAHITRLPVTLFQAAGYAKFWQNLTNLNCNKNQLSALNVQRLVFLQELHCSSNQLSVLNVQGLVALQQLRCDENQLTELNVTGLTALRGLCCGINQLTALNVTGLAALQTLGCSNNQLTALNVTGLVALQTLGCDNNQLTALSVTGLTALKILGCYNNQLTALSVTGLLALQGLVCSNNQLTALNVTGLAALQTLGCSNNQLAALNVTGLTALQTLGCSNNQLAALNVTGLAALQTLYCDNNQLTVLSVTGLPELQTLECEDNQIIALKLTDLPKLQTVLYNNNPLTDLNLTGVPVAIKNQHAELERSLLFRQLNQVGPTKARQAIIARLGADYTYKNCLYYCQVYATKLLMNDSAHQICNLASSALSYLPSSLKRHRDEEKTQDDNQVEQEEKEQGDKSKATHPQNS